MKILISALLTIAFSASSQNLKGIVPWHGLVQVELQNDIYQFEHLKDFGQLQRLILGLSSHGIASSSAGESRDGWLPYKISFVVNDELVHDSRLAEFEVALFKTQNFHTSDNGFKSFMSLELLQWDKETFQSNSRTPITFTRFRPIDTNFVVAKKIGKQVQVSISGKVGFFHSTISSEIPLELQEELNSFLSEGENISFGGKRSENKVLGLYGQGLEVYDFQTIQSKAYREGFSMGLLAQSFKGFLNDSKLSLGVKLFDLIETEVGYKIDSATGYNYDENKFLFGDSHQKFLTVNISLDKILKKANIANGSEVFFYVQNDRMNIRLEDNLDPLTGSVPANPTVYLNKTLDATYGGFGVRFLFGTSQKYRKVRKTLF